MPPAQSSTRQVACASSAPAGSVYELSLDAPASEPRGREKHTWRRTRTTSIRIITRLPAANVRVRTSCRRDTSRSARRVWFPVVPRVTPNGSGQRSFQAHRRGGRHRYGRRCEQRRRAPTQPQGRGTSPRRRARTSRAPTSAASGPQLKSGLPPVLTSVRSLRPVAWRERLGKSRRPVGDSRRGREATTSSVTFCRSEWPAIGVSSRAQPGQDLFHDLAG